GPHPAGIHEHEICRRVRRRESYGLRAFDRFRDRYESFEAVRIRHAPLSRSPRLTRTTFSRWKAPSIHQKANAFTNSLGLAVFYRIHISVNETAAPSNRMEFHGH